jgi:hypothetical protein
MWNVAVCLDTDSTTDIVLAVAIKMLLYFFDSCKCDSCTLIDMQMNVMREGTSDKA